MNHEIPADPFANWPPVIHSADVPRLVKLRDLILTLIMWGILALMLATEMHIAWQAWQVSTGRLDVEVDFALAEFLDKLKPLMLLVGALVLALALATLASGKRRELAVRARQPEPLDPAVVAGLAGLPLQDLEAAAAHPVVTVHRTATGGIEIEQGPPGAA